MISKSRYVFLQSNPQSPKFTNIVTFQVDEVMRRICQLEMNANPGGYQKTVQRIRDAAQISTHM